MQLRRFEEGTGDYTLAQLSANRSNLDVLVRDRSSGQIRELKYATLQNFQLSGSSAPATTKEIEVITDISFSLDKTSYVPKLTATLTKKKIKVVDEAAVESTTANVITFSKQDFVQNTEYSQSDHKFYQDMREILVIPTKDYSVQKEVFEATPHSGG